MDKESKKQIVKDTEKAIIRRRMHSIVAVDYPRVWLPMEAWLDIIKIDRTLNGTSAPKTKKRRSS